MTVPHLVVPRPPSENEVGDKRRQTPLSPVPHSSRAPIGRGGGGRGTEMGIKSCPPNVGGRGTGDRSTGPPPPNGFLLAQGNSRRVRLTFPRLSGRPPTSPATPDQDRHMHIESRPIDSIRPYENNPRQNDDAVAAVAESIRQFGFRQPIVVDGEGIIVIGHTRWRAAKQLGLTEVPVHVAVELTADQIRALRIADNKTAEIAEWDLEKLGIELKAIEDGDLDLDLAALGFDQDELAKLLDPGVRDGLTDTDEIPPVPDAGQTLTQPGDLWVLGDHRLLCGDSTEPDHISRLMDGGQADLLLTDPPYNVAYEGGTDSAMTIANDDMDDVSYRKFLIASLGTSVAVLRAGGAFYCWHADSEGLTVRGACADIGLTVRQCLVWVKSSLVLGRQDYQWKHEPCLYGWKDGAAHTWLSDRCQTTVLAFDKPSRNGEHPTMKPVPLFLYLVQNSCAPGGVVIDPFGGSGTTMIAAEQTGRRARLMELDPRYCDVIVKRWEQFTGKQAQRIAASMNEQTPAEAGAAGSV